MTRGFDKFTTTLVAAEFVTVWGVVDNVKELPLYFAVYVTEPSVPFFSNPAFVEVAVTEYPFVVLLISFTEATARSTFVVARSKLLKPATGTTTICVAAETVPDSVMFPVDAARAFHERPKVKVINKIKTNLRATQLITAQLLALNPAVSQCEEVCRYHAV